MKNEKYIAPEMEVVEVKMDATLLQQSPVINNPCPDHCEGEGICWQKNL